MMSRVVAFEQSCMLVELQQSCMLVALQQSYMLVALQQSCMQQQMNGRAQGMVELGLGQQVLCPSPFGFGTKLTATVAPCCPAVPTGGDLACSLYTICY